MDTGLKSGNYITDIFGIYQIKEIKEEADSSGKTCQYVYYSPIEGSESTYTGHIPLNNLKKAGIRKVLTEKEAKEVLEMVEDGPMMPDYDYMSAKEAIYQNQPSKLVSILKYIWYHQNSLPKNDNELMAQILDKVSREIAFVNREKMSATREILVKKLGEIKEKQE